MRNTTLEGKIFNFKTLVLSKIVYLCLYLVVPKYIIDELENIQENILWKGAAPKINHSTLCNSFAAGGLMNLGITRKITSLQCSWMKRPYDDSFHKWKLVPLHLINTTITHAFKLHPSLA